jgi:phenylacetate-CoA ligase
VPWARYRVNAIIGEETFPESFREYLAASLGVDLDASDAGLIGSSLGVAELGLNLFHETRETVSLRRACARDPSVLEHLLGPSDPLAPVPTFLAYNPLRSFVEIASPDRHGRGELLVTVLDASAPIPLIRYRTGDRVQAVDAARIAAVLDTTTSRIGSVLPVIALHGRAKDRLPSGWHVDNFKDCLYRRRDIARQLTGAFRVSQRRETLHCDVQLASDSKANPVEVASALQADLPCRGGEAAPSVECFGFGTFPYGQTLDYERKFVYWAG